MIILSIETSCDETAAAVVDGDRVMSNVVWSQIKYHREWGGVVPTIARRAHEERLPAVVETAIRRAKAHWNETCATCATCATCGTRDTCIDAIAVTIGPGLAPALEAGIAFAKKLAVEKNLPLIAVSHLEGHIASLFLKRKSGSPYSSNFPNHPNFPNSFLSLIVSGGHTELVETTRMPNGEFPSFNIHHTLLGQTLDDAAGECIDKVGRELGLGYPAGAAMEQLARLSSSRAKSRDLAKRFKFPIPLLRSPRTDLNFSFSGLKTAAVQMLQETHNIKRASQRKMRELAKQEMCDFCASFQEAIIDALLLKLKRAIEATGITTAFLSGGVAANNRLRRRASVLVRSLGGQLYATPKQFTGDNAAMIGLAAQFALNRGEALTSIDEITGLDRQPNLNFELRHKESPIDPAIKTAYESNPFDPLASIRMTGRFIGSIVKYDRKMSPIVLIGSLILGSGFLLLGIFGNNPFNAILGTLILLNVFRNLKKISF